MSNRAKGFTLIELMLVVVIVGMIYAVVFVALDHVLTRYRLRGSARDVLATMQLARSQAISQQRPFRVTFDLSNRSFWLERGGDGAPPARRALGRGVRIEEVQAPGRRWTKGKASVEYTPLGCASPYTIRLGTDDGRAVVIEVNPLHGYAHVQG